MKKTNFWSARNMAVMALFAALTAICAQITIPIGAVPVSLSLLPVLLCALLLNPSRAVTAMLVYMLLGLAGAPVFSGFSGGPAKLFGVTGGYILGYIPCVLVIGLLLKKSRDSWILQILSMVLGVLVCYAFGTVWFMVLRHTGLVESLSLCVFPFLPFDAVKIYLAWLLARYLRAPLRSIL